MEMGGGFGSTWLILGNAPQPARPRGETGGGDSGLWGAPPSLVGVVLVAVVVVLLAVVDVAVGGGAVLAVVDLAREAVHRHALLGRHLVGAHLQRDGGRVARLQVHLLVEDLSLGAGC
ncbi:hypothetical protein ANANG_G00031390, partial [Anguilla anguilla]